jgi:hypothetical protein
MNKVILAFAIVLLGAGEAAAVDLINRDNRDYDVQVASNVTTIVTTISGRSQKSDVCISCTIYLRGKSITASGSDKVIIENGILHRE